MSTEETLKKSTILKILDRTTAPLIMVLSTVLIAVNSALDEVNNESKLIISYNDTESVYARDSNIDFTYMSNADKKKTLNIVISVLYVILGILFFIQKELQNRLNKNIKYTAHNALLEKTTLQHTIDGLSRAVSVQMNVDIPENLTPIENMAQVAYAAPMNMLSTTQISLPTPSEHGTVYPEPFMPRRNEPIV